MRRLMVLGVFLGAAFFLLAPAAPAGIGDFLKDLQSSFGVSRGPSESKIIEGLKEALEIGTNNAVKAVSRLDGYYKNPKIKIPLPDPVTKVEKVLRTVGYGAKIDAFELSMNRAAEKAAPEARSLFWDAIKQMSFKEARKILNGRENEATLYFADKTRGKLTTLFKPIISTSMSQVGVTRYYQELDARVRNIPFAESFRFDLDQYVTDRALDGLFIMVAEEERRIRKDPAARVTDLLKEVFGARK